MVGHECLVLDRVAHDTLMEEDRLIEQLIMMEGKQVSFMLNGYQGWFGSYELVEVLHEDEAPAVVVRGSSRYTIAIDWIMAVRED